MYKLSERFSNNTTTAKNTSSATSGVTTTGVTTTGVTTSGTSIEQDRGGPSSTIAIPIVLGIVGVLIIAVVVSMYRS